MTAEIKSGTAKKAPIGPHIQVQNAIDKKIRNGLRVRRCPTNAGVRHCPSMVVTPRYANGAMSAWPIVGKLNRPITNNTTIITTGPR